MDPQLVAHLQHVIAGLQHDMMILSNHNMELQRQNAALFTDVQYKTRMARAEVAQFAKTLRSYGRQYDEYVFDVLTNSALTITEQASMLSSEIQKYEHAYDVQCTLITTLYSYDKHDMVDEIMYDDQYDIMKQNELLYNIKEQHEMEAEKQRQLEIQRELEAETQRLRELQLEMEREKQRQLEMEREKQRQVEMQRQLEMEMEREKQRQIEMQRQREMQMEREKQQRSEMEQREKQRQLEKQQRCEMEKRREMQRKLEREEKKKEQQKRQQKQAKKRKAKQIAKQRTESQKVKKENAKTKTPPATQMVMRVPGYRIVGHQKDKDGKLKSLTVHQVDQDVSTHDIFKSIQHNVMPHIRTDIIVTGDPYPRTLFEEYYVNTQDDEETILKIAQRNWDEHEDAGALFYMTTIALKNMQFTDVMHNIKQCANLGHGLASYVFGDFILHPSFQWRFMEVAKDYFEKSITSGCPMGWVGLAQCATKCYKKKACVKEDVISFINKAIEYDNDMTRGPGYHMLAILYRDEGKYDEYFKNMKLACAYGYPEAALIIGNMYADHDNLFGVPYDHQKAIETYSRGLTYASDGQKALLYLGISTSYCALGEMNDDDVARQTHLLFLDKAGACGGGDACYHLFHECMHVGETRDGLEWLAKGVKLNHKMSTYRYGEYLMNGKYVKYGIYKDEKRAHRIFTKLFDEHRFPLAAYQLGMIRMTGRAGVMRDNIQAISMLAFASERGVEEAGIILKNLMKSSSSSSQQQK